MKTALKIIIPLLVLAAAIFFGKFLISTKAKPKSRKPSAVVPLVDVLTVKKADHKPIIRSYGTVQSYFQTAVTPQVNGKITHVSPKFRVGEMVAKGDLLVQIDDTDYQSSLATQQANLALQKRSLAEEEIRAKQAAEDWLASGRKLTAASDFVLRKPQLAAARANITSAEASITKAIADIERTKLIAPYDAVVTQRTASLGNLATAQTSFGTLVATSRVEIRLPLTAAQIARVTLPKKSQATKTTIKLTSPNSPGVTWSATLTRTEPTVDPQNQVTYVIAEVKNPYTATTQPLSVGTFVNAAIPMNTIEGVYKIPEAALINDDYVWLVGKGNKLQRLPAERVYSLDANAYVRIVSDKTKPTIRIVSRPLSNFRESTVVKANGGETK